MGYRVMHESFSFWEELGLHIESKVKIIEWLDIYIPKTTMTEEQAEDFENEICLYIFGLQRKKTKKHIHGLFTKTYNERKEKALRYVSKLGLLLIEGMSTKKGRALADMLLDLYKNPQDYIYNTGNVTVNTEKIDSYIEVFNITTDARKNLLNIIKK